MPVTFSKIALVCEPDPDEYELTPRVVVRAVCTMTVQTKRGRVEVHLQSPGVWGVEDAELCAGYPVPAGHWVRERYGRGEVSALKALLDVLE